MVQVFDDLFPPELHKRILDDMMKPKWIFYGGGGSNRFWHMDRLQDNAFYSIELLELIEQRTGISGYSLARIYANGQTAGQSGSPHYDDGDLTFLYFPTEEMSLVDGGHLVFLDSIKKTNAPVEQVDPNAEIKMTVRYKCNRGVLFPANIGHYAEAPNRNFPGLRISIAWKLKKIG